MKFMKTIEMIKRFPCKLRNKKMEMKDQVSIVGKKEFPISLIKLLPLENKCRLDFLKLCKPCSSGNTDEDYCLKVP